MSVSPAYRCGVGGLIRGNIMGIPNMNKGKKNYAKVPHYPPVLSSPPNKMGVSRGGRFYTTTTTIGATAVR